MESALVMDLAVGAVLMFSAVVKGAKGLYKYIMPLFVTVAAIIGALILSRMLTPVVTEVVYPKVEDRVIEKMQEKQTELQQDMLLSGEADVLGGKVKEFLPESLLKLGEKLGQLDEVVSELTEKVGEGASGILSDAQKDKLDSIGAEVREDTEDARLDMATRNLSDQVEEVVRSGEIDRQLEERRRRLLGNSGGDGAASSGESMSSSSEN